MSSNREPIRDRFCDNAPRQHSLPKNQVALINNCLMEDITYETRIVTFLDVLGFKHIISETVKPSEGNPSFSVKQLALIFNKIDAIISDNTDSSQCARFSDSIVIIQKSSPKYESNYFNLIRDIQLLLLREGILVRGAMVKGDIYYNQSGTYFDMFGPAIVRAVELEKQAVYPRVIVDGSVAHGVTFHTFPDGRKFSIGMIPPALPMTSSSRSPVP